MLGIFNIFSRKNHYGIDSTHTYNITNIIPSILNFKNRRIIIALFVNFYISFIISSIYIIIKKPDITVISYSTGDIGLGTTLSNILLNKKYIIDYRDEWEEFGIKGTQNNILKKIYRYLKNYATYCYSKSVLISTVSDNIKNILNKRGLNKVKVITNGANIDIFKPVKKDDDRFNIVYTGQIGKYYSIDIILESMKILFDKGIKDIYFLFAGWGEISDVIRDAKRLDVNYNVQYVGLIKDKKVLANLVASSSLGLVPFDDNALWLNALPAKFFEYCSCGLPVIATVYDNSVLAQIIQQHNIGFHVPPLEPAKLAEKIEKLYYDRKLAVEMGENARHMIEKNYSRKAVADTFLKTIMHNLSPEGV